ncbi:hypothetical protein A2Z33_04190 [Candidatus Gottesmanbacteria bacterium RBG_16_52_11]|uniref:Glycosyltransferase 2-like domain-containing protein n=1 Tax=Candidatus Gottesmanbacteria bacterium RBG_16_52_11 TaxID=1798374 RepID=A0A1F5YVV3_9BACT|nr:MAG: hypothetical protein A2Z33_04190 [Candidatus Gottesmanbacteria bacterium RBG_16_52_11]
MKKSDPAPKLSISFLIPAYNDRETIGEVVRESDEMGKRHAGSYEIIVINDASPDGTAAELTKLSKRYRKLRVITHMVNKGYGETIRELYYAGSQDWLFTVPGDYQIPPVELEKLLPYQNEADMIIGWRSNRQDPPARLRQSRIYNLLLRLMFGLRLHDVNSVRLMKSSVMKSVKLKSVSAFADAELALESRSQGFRIIEVPIGHRARQATGAGGGKLGTILPVIREMLMRFILWQ